MKSLNLAAIAVIGVALLAAAPAARAQGITNPAEHPAPITVTIDGQKYTDGLDTLPGLSSSDMPGRPSNECLKSKRTGLPRGNRKKKTTTSGNARNTSPRLVSSGPATGRGEPEPR